ncbi:putative R3H domain containing protein [Lyophyllum shimeji]|uniref:R3H domain containing protein n=1 Tax=Lyophyllum shimeji TaxID=47721 RepID=A0A9P3PNP6_LYOSH|nr:putative R3H domain containing protein [Lyophyllum shimeji]
MEAGVDIPSSSIGNQITPREKNPAPPRNRQRNANRTPNPPTEPRDNGPRNRQRRPNRSPRGDGDVQARSSPSSSQAGLPQAGVENAPASQKPRRRNPPKAAKSGEAPESSTNASSNQPPRRAGGPSRRGAKFNAGLTEPGTTSCSSDKPVNKYKNTAAARTEPEADDLTSRLIHDLRTPPYSDCPICFNSIHPAQRTWSCSPSIPVIRPPDAETDEAQYCWTTFHLKCIGEWAAKSVKDIVDAWRARGQTRSCALWILVFLQFDGRAKAPETRDAALLRQPVLALKEEVKCSAWITKELLGWGDTNATSIARYHSTAAFTSVNNHVTHRIHPEHAPSRHPLLPAAPAARIPSLALPLALYPKQHLPPSPPVLSARTQSQPVPLPATSPSQAASTPAPRHAIPGPARRAPSSSFVHAVAAAAHAAHQCRRMCCPLASLASAAGKKGKKRAAGPGLGEVGVGEERGGLHECDLVCGKMLGCELHRCEERDHKGACRPCLMSSFEEMCTRPPPLCGHPQSQHQCHEDPRPCPPCPFLATKQCVLWDRLWKVDGLWIPPLLENNASPHTTRAPSPVTRRQAAPKTNLSVHCGRSTTSPNKRQQAAPKCNNDCAIAKRNARLADALGITPESREKVAAVTYHEELVSFARANLKFVGVVEKAFEEFVTTQKKTQVLPHMPSDRRKFVHDLAAVYRMDTQMVDQEPHRSVRLLRRLDTRIPHPLLSSTVAASTPAPPNLGKLADLRATTAASAPSWRASSAATAPKPSGSGSVMGWAASLRPETSVNGATTQPVRLTTATASANVTRASSPARPAAQPPATPTAVPDSWEDDL